MTTERPQIVDDHEAAARWAMRLADHPAQPVGLADLDRWLATDPANADRLDDIFQSWAAVEHYATAEPIMALREQALADTRAREWHGWSWRGALTAASIIVCTIGAGIWFTLQPTTYDTAIGERRVVMLDDGSTLSLDAGTRLSVDYSHVGRDLSIGQGRAKFTVAKDLLRPFAVRAGSKVIVATGTQFSVERIGDEVRVILYEGHVAVLDDAGTTMRSILLQSTEGRPGKSVLDPHQAVTLPVARPLAVAHVDAIDPLQSLTWESGQLVFNDEPLAQVIERINRYAERPLRIGDEGARGIRVSGVFRAGQTEGLTQGLKAAFGARIVQEPSAIAIFSSATG